MSTSTPLLPRLSHAGRDPVHYCKVFDHLGREREVAIPGEVALTIKVDGTEIVTLMTLGTHPEELALGYLRNQRLIEQIEEIASVDVDWQRQVVSVCTRHGQGIKGLKAKLSRVTITSGCGQGTLFSCTLDKLYEQRLAQVKVRQSTIYALLKGVAKLNRIYRRSGSVHGCGLCRGEEVLMYVEDVGRHNAADIIAGRMWLKGMDGADKILFTTGRLTSEIVMKTAFMGIPVLVSKSGITQMGLELAEELGMVVIGRAKARRMLVYTGGQQQVIFDAIDSGGTETGEEDD